MFKCQRCSGMHESPSECPHNDREAKELRLNALAQELYEESNRCFKPLFPWVFVRALKKQQTFGSLILPDIDQNKTVAEGIVLATWQPFYVDKLSHLLCEWCGNEIDKCPGVQCRGPISVYSQRVSAFKPGDHVLFNYWAGVPITGHKPEYYRCVKESNWAIDKEGGIFAKVEYDGNRPFVKLTELITKYRYDFEMSPSEDLAHKIEEQFLLVDRDGESVTISGR